MAFEFDDHQDIGERLSQLGEGFDVVDCLRRQIDHRLADETRVHIALSAHVDAGRITPEEAEDALITYRSTNGFATWYTEKIGGDTIA